MIHSVSWKRRRDGGKREKGRKACFFERIQQKQNFPSFCLLINLYRQFVTLLKESYKALFFKDFALLCANGVCAGFLSFSFFFFSSFLFISSSAGGLVSMLTSNLLLYVKYYLETEKYSTPILLSLMISIGLCIPIWVVVLKKIGKKKACFVGIGPTMIVFLCFIFVEPGQVFSPIFFFFFFF